MITGMDSSNPNNVTGQQHAGLVSQINISIERMSVKVRKTGKVLVDNVSLDINAGQALYVLGPSGCGKSTFLEALANSKKTSLSTHGTILFNGKKMSRTERRQIVSFCSQDVALLGEFTVFETLLCAARLHFGYGIPYEQIEARIQYALASTGLESARDVVVGNIFRSGLSGGQKKRLAIAVELIASPSVIILDEPTSGLDSSSSLGVISTIENLTKLGHTVISSIHSPSYKMWEKFDQVLFMSRGRIVYFGPATGVDEYLQSINLPCPERTLVSDYFISLVNTDFAKAENLTTSSDLEISNPGTGHPRRHTLPHESSAKEASLEFVTMLADKYEASARTMKSVANDSEKASSIRTRSTAEDDDSQDDDSSAKSAGFWPNTLTLTHRAVLSYYKNPGLILIRVVLGMIMCVQTGLMFLFIGENSSDAGIFGVVSVLVSGLSTLSFVGVTAIPFLMEERVTFIRERQNAMYSTGPYVLSKVLIAVPAAFFMSIFSLLIVYYLTSLKNFGILFATLFVLILSSEVLNNTFSSIFNGYEFTLFFTIGLLCIFFITAGFFIPVYNISWAIRWFSYGNPLRYFFYAALITQFADVPSSSFNNSKLFSDGNAVLEYYGVTDDPATSTVGGNLGILLAINAVLIAIGYVALRWRSS